MFHTDVHAVAEIVDNADSVVSKADKAAKVVRAISGWQAFRDYDWLRSVPLMNSAGDLRGMVVSSDWRAVFTFTGKASEYIDTAGTAISILSIMVAMAESYHDVDWILKSNQPPELKAAQLSTQVTGIAMKYLTGIVTTPTHLFLTGLNSVGACDLADRITKSRSGQCRQYLTATDVAIQTAAHTENRIVGLNETIYNAYGFDMWNHIQTELAHILSNQLFPMLKTDPGYMVMLRNAGLTSFPDYEFQTLPNGSTRGKLPESVKQAQSDWAQSKALKNKLTLHKSVQVLSDATRTQLETAARLCAQLAVMHIDSQQSLRERRAEAIVLEGPVTIYRLWDSIDMNQTRNWWFSENLLHEARTKSESAGLSEKEWLRDRLAVSLNSGRCDKLSRLNIAPGSKLPAVAAWGLPMPKYTPVRQNPRAGEPGQPPSIGGVDNRGGTGPDYWASMGQLFLGEKTQYFLPFLPPERISPVA